jgi:regulator of protease activity HflC (stomatin/prohibitin superfamily)
MNPFRIHKTIHVANHERALLFRRDDFVRVLGPGITRLWDFRGVLHVDAYDLCNPIFEHPIDEFLVKAHPQLAEHFTVVELGDHQVGLQYVDGKLRDFIPPATQRIFWKGLHEVRVEVQDILDDFAVPPSLVRPLGHLRGVEPVRLAAAIEYVEVPDNHAGLLYVDGKLDRVLDPGAHAFWRFDRTLSVRSVDTRLVTLEVGGQEILTKDKVSLRLNLTASYRVRDVRTAVSGTTGFSDFLYKELQFALRESVGTRTLDEILASKDELGRLIGEQAARRVTPQGLDLPSVGVKDIILPGEMKNLLNQVVEAEKHAQANLIRRREETAATRSLHNTAKMLERSPTLLRLKELEALEKVTERIDSLTVYGGLDGLLHDLVTLGAGREGSQ